MPKEPGLRPFNHFFLKLGLLKMFFHVGNFMVLKPLKQTIENPENYRTAQVKGSVSLALLVDDCQLGHIEKVRAQT